MIMFHIGFRGPCTCIWPPKKTTLRDSRTTSRAGTSSTPYPTTHQTSPNPCAFRELSSTTWVVTLFVDDDAAFADAAARSFESVGMRTVVALGSMPALDVFDSHDIDVVVTDVKLPVGEPHSSALARMIRNRRPQVPIILMTAHPELLEKEIDSAS